MSDRLATECSYGTRENHDRCFREGNFKFKSRLNTDTYWRVPGWSAENIKDLENHRFMMTARHGV